MVKPHESSSAVSVARGLLLLLQLEVGFLTELERVYLLEVVRLLVLEVVRLLVLEVVWTRGKEDCCCWRHSLGARRWWRVGL